MSKRVFWDIVATGRHIKMKGGVEVFNTLAEARVAFRTRVMSLASNKNLKNVTFKALKWSSVGQKDSEHYDVVREVVLKVSA
jgi:hypothetical protein